VVTVERLVAGTVDVTFVGAFQMLVAGIFIAVNPFSYHAALRAVSESKYAIVMSAIAVAVDGAAGNAKFPIAALAVADWEVVESAVWFAYIAEAVFVFVVCA